jgi:peptide/nickel transport system substrate-binding protein
MPTQIPAPTTGPTKHPCRLARRRRRCRGYVGLIAAATALSVGLVGCGSSGQSAGAGTGASSHAGGTPVSGGTLTYAIDGAQLTLDPGVSQSAVTGLIDRNIFDSLVVQTGPDSFGPWLAKRWTVSPDGKTYTFYLRAGVKFQDGSPFNAAAVKTTLDHVVNPATKSAYAAALIAPYAGATVVNGLTVQIHLSKPFSPFLQALSTPYLGIQSPKALAKPVADYVPVGTGPFEFVAWPQRQNVELARNPSYTSPPANATHTGGAYVSKLDFDIVQEDATRYGALTSGQVSGIGDVPAIDVKTLKGTSGFYVQTDNVPGLNYMLFFNGASGPLSNVLVRRALSAAIDVKQLVRSIYSGEFDPATGVLSPSTGDYSAAAASSQAGYDPAKAEQLLDQAGWSKTDAAGYREKDGQQLTVVWPYPVALNKQNRDVLADGIVADAKKVGIDITRPTVDLGTLVTELAGTKGWSIADAAFARPSPDGLRFAFASDQTYAKGGANVVGLDSPQVDGWLAQATATTNRAVANSAYAKVQAYVLANAYVLPLYTPNLISGYSSKVHGIGYDAQANPIFYNAWLSQ